MLVIVDTNVWIHHLRKTNERLVSLLEEDRVAAHPMIIAELYLGQLREKEQLVHFLSFLPNCSVLSGKEIFFLISKNDLAGTGLGYVDAHLVGSALTDNCYIWTFDKALRRESQRLGLNLE